tara:strand:- start:1335 stop:1721 length:387 start_codon:yes stop_codon:yes gene_type:complete
MFKKKFKDERSFSYVFSIFFLLLGIFPLFNNNYINLNFLFIAFIFLAMGLFTPFLLILPNKLWIRFGLLIGTITTPIVLSLMYIIGIIPVAFLLKLFGKDIINEKIIRESKSYWIKRKDSKTNFDQQF